ncbi:MAG: ROK family protein [Campylobacterales bacterium]
MNNLAVDFGGTHLRYAYIDELNSIEKIKSKDRDIFELFETLLDSHRDIEKIGISFAGQVCSSTIFSAPNILVEEPIDIKEFFAKKGIVAYIENDLKCAALAEADFYGHGELFVAYLGTGFGGAFISNDGLLEGSSNLAGEIGHLPFKKSPLICGCGKDNCVELFCSGSGLIKSKEYYGVDASLSLEDILNSEDETVKLIATGFRDSFLHAIGCGIVAYNPSRVVLGGGIVEANPYLVDFVIKNIANFAPGFALKNIKINKSTLEEGALKGASLLIK